MCRGFEVDPCWGAFRMAGGIAPGEKSRLRGTHTVHVDTQLEAVGDGGATVFHETSEWATKHHTCQLLSSRRRPGNQT